MAIKRKASGPAAGQSPTKRATKIQPPQIFDAPPGDKIVVPRTTTPRGKTYNARKRRTVVPDLEPASPMSRESDDELDILPRTRSGKIPPTPSPSPSKRSRAAKPSPTKPPPLKSPAKRRPPKARTPSPSPIPDSEVESREPSPPIASSSRRASSTMDPIIPPAEEPIPIPPLDISISHAASSELPFCLNAQKREILRAIPNPPNLVDEEEESTNRIALKQLTDLLKGTVVRGEGNSCLLLGPRGSGKTRILNQCISDLPDQPIVLRLCGWSQQSDRLAMREIAYQLSQQTGRSFLTVANDDESAETEPADKDSNPFLDTPNPVTMSLLPSTHLSALISLLPTLSRPTVIILDAFDLFAQHPRQSLLYCLLDTVQSCRAGAGSKGIAVIGMTTRVDTVNLLEKRVKSRFSGRTLRTAPPSRSQDWLELTREILSSKIKTDESGNWQQQWEAGVQAFMQDETTISVLKETFSVTKDLRVLARLLTSVAIQLSPSSPFPTSSQLISAAATQRSRPQFSTLHALPYPSICLLIACVHTETAGHPTFTFEMLYEKVRDQIRISSSAPVEFHGSSIGMPQCPRSVLMSAFESLVSAKIVAPTTAPSASIGKEFVKYRAVVARDDVKKAIQTRNDINLSKWLTKATQ